MGRRRANGGVHRAKGRSAQPSKEQDLLDVVGTIYDTIADPDQWLPALRGIARLVDGHAGSMSIIGPGRISLYLDTIPGANHAEVVRQYNEHYIKTDPMHAHFVRSAARVGSAISSDMCVSESEFERSEAWNEWYRPNNGAFHILTGFAFARNGIIAGAGAGRPKGSPPFGPDERRIMTALTRHLTRAVELRVKFGTLENERRTARMALERLASGAVLVGTDGDVIDMNRAAAEILARNDGLTVQRGKLYAASSREAAELHKLIGGAVGTGNGNGLSSGGAMSISRPSGARAHALIVSPIHTDPFDLGPRRAAALVLIADPEVRRELPPALMRRLYALTPAETRLVEALVNGKTLHEAAGELGVTLNTVRNQLRSILDKTETRRQAELIRLVLSLPSISGVRHSD